MSLPDRSNRLRRRILQGTVDAVLGSGFPMMPGGNFRRLPGATWL